MFQYNRHPSEKKNEIKYQKYQEDQKNGEFERTTAYDSEISVAKKKGYPIIKQDNIPISLQRIPDNRIIPGFDKKTMMVVVNDIKSDTGKGVLYVPSAQIRTSRSSDYGTEIPGYNDVIVSVDGKTLVPYYIEQNGETVRENCSLKEFMTRQRNTNSIDDFLADRLKKIDENRQQENEGESAYGRR